MKGFRIINLSLTNHPILGTNEFKFYDGDDNDDNSPYFTIIIGPNGTGKSEILKCLLLIWRDFYQYFIDEESQYKPLQFFYTLEYTLNGKVYKYSNGLTNKFIALTISGKSHLRGQLFDKNSKIVSISDEEYYSYYPLQIVAQSIMMTDKFFVQRNENEKIRFAPYHYLGIRSTRQQTSTGFYVRRTVDLIIKAINNKYFKKGISNLIDFIGATGSFIIQYKTKNHKLFYTGNLTAEILDDYFKEIEKNYEGKIAPFKLADYNKLKKNVLELLKSVEFVNKLVNEDNLDKIDRSSAKALNFDLRNNKQMEFLERHQYDIDRLRKLGLLSPPTIKFSDKDVELQNASSGEFHLFTTMIGLMASTRNDSLVIIDEPEISLHPNWQMKYLQFIRELFADTDRVTSHIIIATHSHFLVSDLPGENSTIIGLKKEDGEIESLPITKNTFGWSAEEVLLEIFQVPTTRNHFISEKIGEILDEIANPNKNVDLIKSYVQELLEKNIDELSNEDPLKEIVDKLVEKYG
ncbi:AAA family ATPase [Winogradskyella forsetii]|uniref:AAA family ATPase n=1 Tax=Winogradskyella forsetii TaxID=2686077 RepID=UPI0015BBE8F6|nr:AAA family ATPase [Winogradskyella forsetii]